MSIVVVATIYPRPEHRAAVTQAYLTAVAAVHQEDDCQLYALHERDDRLVMIEQWTSQLALDAHSAGPAIAALNAEVAGLLAGTPEVLVFDALPAGDAVKGVLVA